MTISRSSKNSNMQPRAHSSGWAAFDHKQRNRQGSGSTSGVDPFPSITNFNSSGPTKAFIVNHSVPARTFSAVRPSQEFPMLVGESKSRALNNNSCAKKGYPIKSDCNFNPVQSLKDIHGWADQSLIADILTAVNSDVNQASLVLKEMISPESEIKEAILPDVSSSMVPSGEHNKFLEQNALMEAGLPDYAHKVLSSRQLFSVPVESDWEEDDIYLIHRKEAIRMMRAASQHSRAASNAFLRGDHVSAHQLSDRAREEWMVAEKLNAKAAEEILLARNKSNEIWKLDLHGLHATEAVSALKEHLHRIESQTVMNRSASSDGLGKLVTCIVRSSSLASVGSVDVDSSTKENKVQQPQHRQTILHVITGTGNHSRGQASLPLAVRSFLIENSYRFDDARPGVIAVRPKFRQK